MTPLQAIADLNDLTLDLPRFEQALDQFAAKLQLDLSQFSADHISVGCHQGATAERWRQGLMQCASLLSESMINGPLHARALSYLADEALLAADRTLDWADEAAALMLSIAQNSQYR